MRVVLAVVVGVFVNLIGWAIYREYGAYAASLAWMVAGATIAGIIGWE